MSNHYKRSVILLGMIWFGLLTIAEAEDNDSANQAVAKEKTVVLAGEVIDATRREPLPARVSIKSSTGDWYFPKSTSPQGSAVVYQRQRGPTSLEQHVTLSAHPFEVELPAGRYTITVERGKEYIPLSEEVTIEQKPASVTLPLKRWIKMTDAGWYSGDVHVHRPLSDLPNLVIAEDLNVAMPSSHWVTTAGIDPIDGNRVKDPVPRPDWIAVDATHGIHPLNTEYEISTVGGRAHTLGAVLILGQSTVLDQGVPPVRRVAEKARKDGAFIDLEKHSWAWSPLIVAMMKPDLFELANNHCWPTDFAYKSWTIDMAPKSMQLETTDEGFTEWGWIDFGFKSYYAYLNCGFRMMPSAGTANGVHPVPLGFGRVYVHVPGEFTYQKWRDALLAGRSFVTTGPLMQIQFSGQQAGQPIRGAATGTAIQITGSISSLAPLERIEIIVNGMVSKSIAGSLDPSADKCPHFLKLDETISVNGSGWVAVRAFESLPNRRIRFAHTAPVFVDVPGQRLAPYKDEVEHFVERIEREIARNREVLSPDALDEYQEALGTYKELQVRAIERPDLEIVPKK